LPPRSRSATQRTSDPDIQERVSAAVSMDSTNASVGYVADTRLAATKVGHRLHSNTRGLRSSVRDCHERSVGRRHGGCQQYLAIRTDAPGRPTGEVNDRLVTERSGSVDPSLTLKTCDPLPQSGRSNRPNRSLEIERRVQFRGLVNRMAKRLSQCAARPSCASSLG
jgi:hypothetical protein